MPKINHRDNYGKYSKRWKNKNSFENYLSDEVKKCREEWIEDPFCIDDEYQILRDDNGNIVYEDTIRMRLKQPDSKFYKGHNYYYAIRCPRLVRSNKEWENFYKTFPCIARDVIIGKQRYCNGAKLKFIPLFQTILDKVWPEDEDTKLTKEQFSNGEKHIEDLKKEYEEYKLEYGD